VSFSCFTRTFFPCDTTGTEGEQGPSSSAQLTNPTDQPVHFLVGFLFDLRSISCVFRFCKMSTKI